AAAVDTLVIFMGVAKLQEIAEGLVRGGAELSKPVAIVESGTTPKQKVRYSSLGEILDGDLKGKIDSPALIVIGDVIRAGRELRTEGAVDFSFDVVQNDLMQSRMMWCAAAEYA